MATNQPFTILVLGLEETPELAALAAAGHTLLYCKEIHFPNLGPVRVDQVVGPHCWRLLPEQMKWVPLMAKEMRAKQPSKRKKKASDGTPAS